MKHKHAELIKAWADGAEIEIYMPHGQWVLITNPQWNSENLEYRIKPEPKPDYQSFLSRGNDGWKETAFGCFVGKPIEGFVITRDGETNEIKSVEILK
jgi:hypothetical protein